MSRIIYRGNRDERMNDKQAEELIAVLSKINDSLKKLSDCVRLDNRSCSYFNAHQRNCSYGKPKD
jgi:hypothetical protein